MALTVWTDSILQSFVTKIKSVHISELRTAVNNLEQSSDDHLANLVRHINYGVATGSTNAYVVNVNPAPTSLVAGMTLAFQAHSDNTGPCTLKVNTMSSKSLKTRAGDDLPASYIKAGQIVLVTYDGTNFQVLSVGSVKPTTLAGYGITDAVPTTGNTTITGTLNTNGLLISNNSIIWGTKTMVDTTNTNSYVFNTGDSVILEDGRLYQFRCTNASTGNVTLKINGLSALPLRLFPSGTQAGSGAIKANKVFQAWYSSAASCFYLNPSLDEAGVVTNDSLASDIKIGSLTGLATVAKGSVVSAINEVKSTADSAAGGVASLSGTVSGLSGTVSGLSGTVSGLSGTVASHETSLGNLQGSINSVSGSLSGHAGTVASSGALGHVKASDAFGNGVTINANNELCLDHRPQPRSGSASYTDSFTTVFNVTKTIPVNAIRFFFRMLTIIAVNRSDNSRFLVYHIYPYQGSTYGVVIGRNSSNDVLALPYNSNGSDFGIQNSATTIGYQVPSNGKVSMTIKGINSNGSIEIQFVGAESTPTSLNVDIHYFLS